MGLRFEYPEDMNPFMAFQMVQHGMGFQLVENGSVVMLSVGVKELFFRHPENWGWGLFSGGTLWTGFEMPKVGEDPLLAEENVENLVERRPIFGYRF